MLCPSYHKQSDIVNVPLTYFPAKTLKSEKPFKMAVDKNSLAKELLSVVSPFNYRRLIPCLDTDDFMSICSFKDHVLSEMFIIDKSACIQNGEINNQHLFETFGLFSDEDADSVCSDIIEHIETSKSVYECVGEEFFSHQEWSIMDWALATCSQFYYGDELLLYVLCHVFHRHAVVIYKEWYWCTFQPDKSMNIYALLDCCDLHFVYLCPGIFA